MARTKSALGLALAAAATIAAAGCQGPVGDTGATGASGATGAAGMAGPSVYLEDEEGDAQNRVFEVYGVVMC